VAVADDSAGDCHSLPFAAGEVIRIPIGVIGDAEHIQRL